MASIRDIFVRLGIKTDPKGFNKVNKQFADFKQHAIRIGGLLGAGAFAFGFRELIDLASDSAETANKFGAVFQQAGNAVQKQLDEIAKRTGATEGELQGMASNIGALVKPALGSAEAAGDMAAKVSELALDISSFNNVTTDQALIALRSGLIGSSEPLSNFGVDVRNAALEQEALRLGLGKTLKDMTEGERTQLRFASIVRQLGSQGALGDATTTARDYANASRNLGKAIKAVGGTIGTFFLKWATKSVNETRKLIDAISGWLAENRKLIQQKIDAFIERFQRVTGAVVDLVVEAAQAARSWYQNLGPVGQRILQITGAILAFLAVLMLPAAPILLLIALIALLIEDFQVWRKGGESVIGDLIAWFGELGERIDQWAEQAKASIAAAWEAAKTVVLGVIDELIAAVQSYVDAITDTLGEFWAWVEEHQTGIRLVTSLVIGLGIAIKREIIKANIAAAASTAKTLPRMALMYARTAIVMSLQWARAAARATVSAALSAAGWIAGAVGTAASWLATSALMLVYHAAMAAAAVASAAAAAAAWIVATFPLILTTVLLGVLIGMVIWLGWELLKLVKGEDNFFSTMWQGIKDLIKRFGGIGPALVEIMRTALIAWVKLFTGSEEKAKEWVDNLQQTLMGLWDNVVEHWSEKLSKWWDEWGDFIDFGFGGDNEEETDRRARELYERSEQRRIARQQGRAGASVVNNNSQNINMSVAPPPGTSAEQVANITVDKIRTVVRQENDRQLRQASFATEVGAP